MQRRQFLQAGAVTSALLALPLGALARSQPPRFALGYLPAAADARWQPALARSTPGATRVRVTAGIANAAAGRVHAHVDLVYRTAGQPAYCLTSLHRPGQRVTLDVAGDVLAGLRVHCEGHAHELAFTDAFQPLLAAGTYALLGAHPGLGLPDWSALAPPNAGRLDRRDGALAGFDAFLIHVATA